MGRTGWAWATFEWARNPYYILIVIYVFAPYLARDIIGADLLASGALDGLDPATAQQTANAEGQATIASVTKWAGVVAALSAPFLGAALDRGGRLKPVLAIPVGVIITCSALLWFALPGAEGLPTPVILALLVIGYVSFTYTEVIHNAMLPHAGPPSQLSAISGMGLALANLAATLIFTALVMLFVLPALIQWPFAEPQLGFDLDRFEHVRIVGPICAVWFLLFSIPFFCHAVDPGVAGRPWGSAISDGARSVIQTFRQARAHGDLMKFLLARILYADGMAALLALGAVYVSLFLEWGILEMLIYAIAASAWAFAGGIFGGWLDNRIGVKHALIVEILLLSLAFSLQLSVSKDALLFGLLDNVKVWDGLVFQTLSDLVYLALISVVAVTITASISTSRAMLVKLAPPGRSGEFFGLFAIAGTITVWIGPMLVEFFTLQFNSQRLGMASIAALFFAGLIVLTFVQMPNAPSQPNPD